MFQSITNGCRRYGFPSILLLVSTISLFVGSQVLGQLPTIAVHSLSQSAAQIGSKLKLKPRGSQLDELQSLLSTQPALVGVAANSTTGRLLPSKEFNADFGDGSFEVDVRTTAEAGLCEIRFKGRFGVSNPRRFLLTNSKVMSLNAEQRHGEDSVELRPDVIWTTKCIPKAYQSLNVPVQEGDRLRIVICKAN